LEEHAFIYTLEMAGYTTKFRYKELSEIVDYGHPTKTFKSLIYIKL